MPAETAVRLIREPTKACTLMQPLRLRILRLLREPQSASGLARRLHLPRQRVNYHLRELEKQGLVQLVVERKKGNCVERVVRAAARSYLISPEALGELAADPDQLQDRFSSAYLVAVTARALSDLGLLRSRADATKKRLATFTLQTEICFASPADRAAFAEEVANEVARLVSKHHNERAVRGRTFKLFLGAYPAITAREKGQQSSKEER